MKCPICKRDAEEGLPHSPFCSERCKMIDLGRWASEAYVVATPLEAGTPAAAPANGPGEDDGG